MKAILKAIVHALALVIVCVPAAAEILARRLLGRDVWFAAQGELLGLLPGKIGSYIRNAYYRLTLQSCHLDCNFGFGTTFSHSGAEVGHRVIMGASCIIGLASIGENTMMADHIHVLSGRHQHGTSDPTIPFRDQPGTYVKVRIGRNCWVGANCVIMADVGDNCIIGAGSVVTRAIPEGRLVAGNPARVLGPSVAQAAPKA